MVETIRSFDVDDNSNILFDHANVSVSFDFSSMWFRDNSEHVERSSLLGTVVEACFNTSFLYGCEACLGAKPIL